jgi:hypothetical protein
VGPRADLDAVEKGNNRLSLLGIKTYFFNYPTCSLVSACTALLWEKSTLHVTNKIVVREKSVTGHLRNIFTTNLFIKHGIKTKEQKG